MEVVFGMFEDLVHEHALSKNEIIELDYDGRYVVLLTKGDLPISLVDYLGKLGVSLIETNAYNSFLFDMEDAAGTLMRRYRERAEREHLAAVGKTLEESMASMGDAASEVKALVERFGQPS